LFGRLLRFSSMNQQNKEPTKVSRTTAGFFFRKECIN
jgi:hypothetical protein